MAETPEELALELSRSALESQARSETQLREKATAILSAASIIVPIAGVALKNAPKNAAIPLIVGAIAYICCAVACGAALLPRNWRSGLLGGALLKVATDNEADLAQMQASASTYLDDFYRENQSILEGAAKAINCAIGALSLEILALVGALVVTLTH